MSLFQLRLLFQYVLKIARHSSPTILGTFERTSIFETGLFEMKASLSII